MTDRPILFSAPMIRALLDDSKTQTRRILKPQGFSKQPKIHTADRLWPRESWSGTHAFRETKPSERESFIGDGVPYLRDEVWYWADGDPDGGDWERPRPSIHMPRWASRMTLTVTDVRVQRLQEIGDADAMAEGMKNQMTPESVEAFVNIWNSINGPDAWSENPWVAAYTFTVRKGNIDERTGT